MDSYDYALFISPSRSDWASSPNSACMRHPHSKGAEYNVQVLTELHFANPRVGAC